MPKFIIETRIIKTRKDIIDAPTAIEAEEKMDAYIKDIIHDFEIGDNDMSKHDNVGVTKDWSCEAIDEISEEEFDKMYELPF